MVQEAQVDRIYLDHAATSTLLPEAREAMLPWLTERHGNPSSLYAEGRDARSAIDDARETLSEALGCLFAEVIFTSSGTEAANMAILGAALANEDGKRLRVLMSAIEHHCVLETRGTLERLGYEVETIPVTRDAVIDTNALSKRIGDDVLLVCGMHANNEVGTIQPAHEIAHIAHSTGALFLCDAVQSFLTVDWRIGDIDADFVSLSAHKIGGPKGIGALYTRAGIKTKPLLVGGGQEREMRAGTENVAGIAGFAGAIKSRKAGASERMRAARDAFLEALTSSLHHIIISSESDLLPGHTHLRFPGLSAESMLIVLDRMGVSASSGAACSSGSLEASHVLLACGYSEKESREGLRFTFGPSTTIVEAQEAARRVLDAADQVAGAKRRATSD